MTDEPSNGEFDPEVIPWPDDRDGAMPIPDEAGVVSLSGCAGILRRVKRLLGILGKNPDFFTMDHYNQVLRDLDVTIASIAIGVAESDRVSSSVNESDMVEISDFDLADVVRRLPAGSRIILERDA